MAYVDPLEWLASEDFPNFTAPARHAWHYTNAAGLMGIVTSQTLFASATEVVNDSSEVNYGIDLVRQVWKDVAARSDFPPANVTYISEALSDDWPNYIANSIFIVSASEDSDLLGQWRGYAGGDGFAIGFDLESTGWRCPGPARVSTVFPLGWRKVTYDTVEQRALAEAHLRAYAAGPAAAPADWASRSDARSQFMPITRAKLSSLVSLLKHPAFADEREVRHVEGTIGGEVRFRATGRGIVPYVEMRAVELIRWNGVSLAGDEITRLPIHEVAVGPGAGPSACASLQRYLASHGYGDVNVRMSSIPLRP